MFLKTVNNLLLSLYNDNISALAMLDVSSSFVAIYHLMAIQPVQKDFNLLVVLLISFCHI